MTPREAKVVEVVSIPFALISASEVTETELDPDPDASETEGDGDLERDEDAAGDEAMLVQGMWQRWNEWR
jgi:hypothetical protein